VKSVSGDDIVCEAKNSAVLAGLLTLVHSRGPAGATAPVDMPLLADADRAAFKCVRGPSKGCIGILDMLCNVGPGNAGVRGSRWGGIGDVTAGQCWPPAAWAESGSCVA
jgi:hypothetical protein